MYFGFGQHTEIEDFITGVSSLIVLSCTDLRVSIHLVKEGTIISSESHSSARFLHGIKVLMARNYVENLSEEVKKGMHEKAWQGHWPRARRSRTTTRKHQAGSRQTQ